MYQINKGFVFKDLILITLRDIAPHMKENNRSIWGMYLNHAQNSFRLAKLKPTNCLINLYIYIYINVLPAYFLLYPYKWVNKSMSCRNNLPPVGRNLNEWVTIKFRAKRILSKEVGGKQQWRAWDWDWGYRLYKKWRISYAVLVVVTDQANNF